MKALTATKKQSTHDMTSQSRRSNVPTVGIKPSSLLDWLARQVDPRIVPVCTDAGAGSGSMRFRKKFRRFRRIQKPLVQSQLRFNRVPEKFPEKVLEKVRE